MENRSQFGEQIWVIDRCPDGGPAAWAKKEFMSALEAQQMAVQRINHWTQGGDPILIIGETTDRLVERLLELNGVEVEMRPECFLYRWCSTGVGSALVIAGTDGRGLMYALLELADRLNADGGSALESVQNLLEYPDNRVRGVNRFVMGHLDDEWFYSEDFWHYYLERLARCRFNRFVLIMGFDTAYLSPPYPFFVEVPGYPQVRPVGVDDQRRKENLSRLRQIGRMCREYGLEFILGTWQQTPWTARQQVLVEGLPEEEGVLAHYCAAGLKALLSQCHEIDGIHFRVNHEAGIGDQNTNEAFWKECIQAAAEAGRKLKLDLRAKGLTDGMIQFALEAGLDLAIPTKYWCEHAGLPHHLTQMREEELTQLDNLNHSRRYSYSDLLRKPHAYDMIFRLWNMGSSCIFLWGDPDYARRYCHSSQLGGAAGYEITAPLSMKGGHELVQDKPWFLFKNSELRHYEYEDERYWLWYLLFGRIGYSADTDPDVWAREFRSRFGAEAAALLERAYRSASKILPLVTAFHMPVHPMLCYWTEVSTGGPLFAEHNHHKERGKITYINTEPSDPGLFYRINEYVRDVIENRIQGKYTPLQGRDWLRMFSSDIRTALDQTDNLGALKGNREYQATRIDLRMLADLADYHAWKIKAAIALEFFNLTHDSTHLPKAHTSALEALERWRSLASRGEAHFHDHLDFSAGAGYGRTGNWKDRLPELEKDVRKLAELLEEAGGGIVETGQDSPGEVPEVESTPPNVNLPSFEANVPAVWKAGEDLVIDVVLGELTSVRQPLNLYYRHVNQLEGAFKVSPMEKRERGYRGVVPGEYILPEWDLMVYFSGVDQKGQPLLYPGLYHAEHPAPYFTIEVVSTDFLRRSGSK